MIEIVKSNFEYREKNNVLRKDFIQLLMELRKCGELSENDEDFGSATSIPGQSLVMSLSIEECAAQVCVLEC